jgi:hypothetical protein
LVLTDDPTVAGRTNAPLETLSFLAPRGFALFQADAETDKGADHLRFKLEAFGETVRLYSGLQTIDEVVILPQLAGTSEGRSPDGSDNIAQFPGQATPGGSNAILSTDRDGDGLPDDWEEAHGLNAGDPQDALRDEDADGLSNLAEFRAGTDPRDGTSVLRMAGRRSAAGVEMMFRAAEGRSYSILAAESLGGEWQRLSNIAAGPARDISLQDAAGPKARFYRVVTPLLP